MKAINKKYGKSKWINTRHGDKYLKDCALINTLYKMRTIDTETYKQTIKEINNHYGVDSE
jgi:hypothetical protein